MHTFSPRIDDLLTRHHVLSLSAVFEGEHWAAPLFYVFDAANARLVFATDPTTRHGALMAKGADTVATISRETREVAEIEGLQLHGPSRRLDADSSAAERLYRASFAVPARVGLHLWELRPTYIKATDNRETFGEKEEWSA